MIGSVVDLVCKVNFIRFCVVLAVLDFLLMLGRGGNEVNSLSCSEDRLGRRKWHRSGA